MVVHVYVGFDWIVSLLEHTHIYILTLFGVFNPSKKIM